MSGKYLETKNPRPVGAIRHVHSLMLFFGMLLAYSMRVNMSMAIVVMTDTTLENSFDWSMQTQSVILSSFFWGYVVFQIPAGELASKYGGMIFITLAIAVNSIVSIALPSAAYYGGWQLLCACRIIQGLTQGFVIPSAASLIAKWAPLEEKGRTITITTAGCQFGNALQLVTSGYIAAAWGWEAIFYVNGVVGIVWVVLYVILGADSPQKSKFMSVEEWFYIQNSLGQIGEPKKFKTPWKKIWTSIPFLSLIVVHCSQNWGYWTLMTEMPSYMKRVLEVDIRANGLMSALPYLTIFILSFPFGYLADYLPNKKYLSVTATRKLSNSIGLFGPAIALIGLSYVPAGNVTLAVVLLTTVVGLNVGHLTGLKLVALDMAPNYVGTLVAITNMAANFMSIIAPLVAGAVIKDETNPDEWRKIFYIASAIYIVGNLCYLIFGTSERQTWNETPAEIDDVTPEKTADKIV